MCSICVYHYTHYNITEKKLCLKQLKIITKGNGWVHVDDWTPNRTFAKNWCIKTDEQRKQKHAQKFLHLHAINFSQHVWIPHIEFFLLISVPSKIDITIKRTLHHICKFDGKTTNIGIAASKIQVNKNLFSAAAAASSSFILHLHHFHTTCQYIPVCIWNMCL